MGKRKRITFSKSKKIKKNIAKNEKSAVVLENNPQVFCEPITKLKIGEEYTGAQVNAINTDPLVKLTNESENHNGFVFATGENCDTMPFRPYGSCSAGGLYFCKKNEVHKWLQYNFTQMHYIRSVTLPDDARVYIEENKMKADKFILGERETIFDNKPLFDYLLQHGCCMWNKTCLFNFDTSFYDEHTWNIILQSTFFESYCVPEKLRSPMLNKIVLQQLQADKITISQALDLIGTKMVCENEDICEILVSNGLDIFSIPGPFRTRQVLRCFLRQHKIAPALFFPSSLFLDKTLLDGISLSRQERKIITQKKLRVISKSK
jgi:hypothetical protein